MTGLAFGCASAPRARSRSHWVMIGVLGCSLLSAPALAQDAVDLRERYLLRVPPPSASEDDLPEPEDRWTIPNMGGSSPIAFGASFGDVGIGGSYQVRTRYREEDDAVAGLAFGLGDPVDLVGLQIGVISFSTFRSGFGKVMGIDFHLHRVLPRSFGIGIGWESAITRGKTDGGSNRYAVVSKWLPLREETEPFSALMLSVGVGDGRFLSEEDFNEGADKVNIFGSAALRVASPLSVIADWTGQDLLLASSVAPFRSLPVVLTVGFNDVTGTAGDGARFVASASAGYDFRPD